MAGIEFDTSELRKLATDLGNADARIAEGVRATTAKAALNIKKQLQSEAEGHKRFPHFPRSITFDTQIGVNGIEAEIGPDKDRMQGALGNLLYFGTARNGPTLPDPGGALDAEKPNYMEWLGKAAADGILP